MKRILFIFLILLSFIALADDEILLNPDNNIEIQKDLLEGEHEVIYENPIELEINPYSKESLKGIITRDYNLDVPDGLFKEQLTFKFNKKFFKQAEFKLNYKTAMVEKIDEDDSDFKFDPNSITIGIKGKFSSKEGFNTLFQLNPTDSNFFKKLVLDSWVESNRIKNNTIILGTSRPTVGLDGSQSYYTLPFFARSQSARNFAAIRKTGLRIKGDYKYFDYDIGGYSSDTWYQSFFPEWKQMFGLALNL